MGFAFIAEVGEFRAFKYFDDEVAAGLKVELGKFEGATGDVNGAVVVGGLVAGGGIHHVGEDDVEEFVAQEFFDLFGGGIGEGVAVDGVDALIPEFVLFLDGLEVYADDEAGGFWWAEVLEGNLEPGAGGTAEVEDAASFIDELAFVLDFLEFEG